MSAPVGPDPSRVQCPSCHQSITTRTENTSTRMTHIIAIVLCLFMCWPCVCLPYCTSCCRNTDHYCPNCNAYIGTYTRN